MKPAGTILVDTNVLVYAFERAASSKGAIAKELVERLWLERRGVISLQNLSELCSVCLTRFRPPVPAGTMNSTGLVGSHANAGAEKASAQLIAASAAIENFLAFMVIPPSAGFPVQTFSRPT